MTERVLIVKLAALGDAIMASTLVPAIHARWPQAEITWAVGESIAPLVRLFEGVHRVVAVDEQSLFKRGRIAAVGSVLRSWRQLGRGYDLALIGHTDARYRVLSLASGSRTTRQFAGAYAPRGGRWHGDEYVRLLDSPALPAPHHYATVLTNNLPTVPSVPGAGALIVIAPGGGRNVLRDDPLRRWPRASWTATVRALVLQGHRVVAVGSAADHEEGTACQEAGATDLTGRTTLLELAALIRASNVVVTHDSGTLHLSLLFNKPTVALFGPTVPAERIPKGAPAVVLSRAQGLPCAPCYNGIGYAECALNICLSRVGALDVLEAVQNLLVAPRPMF